MRVARLVLVSMCNTSAVSVSALSLLRQLVSAAPANKQFLSSDTSAATALWECHVAIWNVECEAILIVAAASQTYVL